MNNYQEHDHQDLSDQDLEFISAGSSGAEMSMIQLQSVISQRQIAVQMTSSLLKSIHDTQKSIIGNIR